MTQLSRLSLIGPEFWLCERCGWFEADEIGEDRRCPHNECGGPLVEYVPAADHRGAVEALRWALGFIEYQGEPSPLGDPREGEADAESYRRALALVGER
jgi:hypothetical protein